MTNCIHLTTAFTGAHCLLCCIDLENFLPSKILSNQSRLSLHSTLLWPSLSLLNLLHSSSPTVLPTLGPAFSLPLSLSSLLQLHPLHVTVSCFCSPQKPTLSDLYVQQSGWNELRGRKAWDGCGTFSHFLMTLLITHLPRYQELCGCVGNKSNRLLVWAKTVKINF